MKRNIYYCYAPVEPHQCPRHYHFSFQFSYNFFLTFSRFLNNYTFSNLSLFFAFSSLPYPLPYIFISLLSSTLISLFIFPFIFLFHFFCHFLFMLSYYKFVILSFILYILYPHEKKCSLSLSLSLSLSQFFGWFFIFLAYLL